MQLETHTTNLHNSSQPLVVDKPFYAGTGKNGTQCIQNKLDGGQFAIGRTLGSFCVREHSMGENIFPKSQHVLEVYP